MLAYLGVLQVFFLCVCVLYVCMHVEARGQHHTFFSIVLHTSFFLRQDLSLTLKLMGKASWLVSFKDPLVSVL